MGFIGLFPMIFGFAVVYIGIVIGIILGTCVVGGIGRLLVALGKRKEKIIYKILGYICYWIPLSFLGFIIFRLLMDKQFLALFGCSTLYLIPLLFCILVADIINCLIEKNFGEKKKKLAKLGLALVMDFVIFIGVAITGIFIL